MRIRFLVLIYCATCFYTKAFIYYVDPNNGGSNSNSGLIGSPWATIQKAASTAQAGDTVYVQTGTYAEKVAFNHSGTEDALITFIGVGSVVVQEPANTTVWSGTFTVTNKSYIRIQHFNIQNAYWFGIYVEASDHIYVENNSTYNTGASGISVWHSSHVYAAHNTVRKACYQSLSTGSQECITFSGVSDFEIHHNEIYESGGSTNGGEGIDAKEDCANGKIYNNMVHDLIRLGIYIDCWNKTLHDIDIYNNKVFQCKEGIVISSEDGGTVSDVRVFNNILYSNAHFGITVADYVLNGPRKNISIMNNTIYNNGFGDANTGWGGGIIILTANVSDVAVFNNIVSENDAMQISDKSGRATVSVTNNLIYGYRGYNWTNEVKGTNAVESNPLFRDVNGADNISGNADDDLNVTSESAAINHGINTNAPSFDFNYYQRPAENVADIGAYESNSIPLTNKKISPAAEQLIQVYPNPSNTGIFNVKCIKPVDRMEIADMTGTIIQCFTSPNETILHVALLKPGMYLMRVYSQDICQVYKIIKSD
jgi:parallel beta-helix repeat protein